MSPDGAQGAEGRPPRRGRGARVLRGLWLAGAALVLLCGAVVAWQTVAGRRPAAERQRLAARGRMAYAVYCATCHGAHLQGRTLPTGVVVPPLDKPGFRVLFLLLPAAMEGWVREQISEGNPVMPRFGLQLDPETLDALAAYLRLVNTRALAPG